MTKIKFTNSLVTALAASIAADATSLTLLDGSTFPATGPFIVRVGVEVCIATARSGNVLTVTRGADGTTATEAEAGTPVYCVISAGTLASFLQNAVDAAVESPVVFDCNEVTTLDFVTDSDCAIAAPLHPANGARLAIRVTNNHGSFAIACVLNAAFELAVAASDPGALGAGKTRLIEGQYHSGLAKWLTTVADF